MSGKLSPATRFALICCLGLLMALTLASANVAIYFTWGKAADVMASMKVPHLKPAAAAPTDAERELLIKALNQQLDSHDALIDAMQRSTGWWRDYAIGSTVEFLTLGLLFGLLLVEIRRLDRRLPARDQ